MKGKAVQKSFSLGRSIQNDLPDMTVDDLTVKLSSYDIPDEVSASEGQDGWYHIRFTYPDHEKPSAASLHKDATLSVGRFSGKILGIDFKKSTDPCGSLNTLIGKIEE